MGKRQKIREQRRKKELGRRLLWGGGLVVALAVVLALVLPNVFPPSGRGIPDDLVQPANKPFSDADFNRLGSKDAPVKVVAFADYECGACQDFALMEEKSFLEKYVSTGQVQYEYVSVAYQNPNRTKPIEATYCAGDQGAFWPFREYVYANFAQNRSALDDNYLTAYAEALELDLDQFDTCLTSGKYKNVHQENMQETIDARITATPNFLVNGTIAGRLDLMSIVATKLAEAGLNP